MEEVLGRDTVDEGGGIESSNDDKGVSSSFMNESWLPLSTVVVEVS